MGGKAIKKVQISRINKNDYELIKKNIFDILSKDFQLEFIYDLPEKEDFGDLDILYQHKNNKNIKDYIIQNFNPNEIVSNGNVISFDFKLNDSIYFQIDLIKTSNLEIAKFYFSYGDVGGILGRLCNYYDLVFGFDGLWLNLNVNTINEYLKKKNLDSIKNINGDYNFGKIILTINPNEICEYIDLDYEKWKNGFTKNENIIQWFIESKYFKKEIFCVLNRDHRERFEQRKFYKEFINYIIKEDEIGNSSKKIKINIQLHAIEYFKKDKELNNLIQNFYLNNERKDKFNGYIFKEFGIEDKKLGENIKNFKYFIQSKFNISFDEWIDQNNKNDIKNIIGEYLLL